MLSILLTSNFPLLETSLLVHNKKLLSPMLAYYFGFTNIRFHSTNIGILFCFCSKVGFLYTNIGILFLFYQHSIALHQYRYINFCLPMSDSSIPLLVNYFPLPTLVSSIPKLAYYFFFTNIGFLFTNIGILSCFFYQWWIPLYHYWYIFFVLPMLGYITLYQHWYVIYSFQR